MEKEKAITSKYLNKLGEKGLEIIEEEKSYRYSDKGMYLINILESIDRICATIERGRIRCLLIAERKGKKGKESLLTYAGNTALVE